VTELEVRPDAAEPAKATVRKRKPKSDAMDSVHQLMGDLYDIGLISTETMRTFDVACLEPPKNIPPARIAQIRKKAHMSQPVFALYLGTTKSTVAKWESGEKIPSGPSRRLLEIISRHGIGILTA
jgi:putative transcriptional regulator